MRALSRVLPILILLAACGGEPRVLDEQLFSLDSRWTRSVVDSTWRPLRLALDRSALYALDPSSRALTALDRFSGELQWRTDLGSVSAPRSIAVAKSGTILVADFLGRSVLRVNDRGEVESRTPFFAPILSMCALADSATLLLTTATPSPILLVDSTFRIISRYDLPWPDLARAMPDRFDGRLHPVDGGCLYIVDHEHLALWTRNAFRTFQLPPSGSIVQSRFGAGAADDSSLVVGFTEDGGARLHTYRRENLMYSGTAKLDAAIVDIIADRGCYYAILERRSSRQVEALGAATCSRRETR